MIDESLENTLDTLCECINNKNMEIKVLRKQLREKETELENKNKEIEVLNSNINRQFEQITTLIKENDSYRNLKKASKEVKKIMEELNGE